MRRNDLTYQVLSLYHPTPIAKQKQNKIQENLNQSTQDLKKQKQNSKPPSLAIKTSRLNVFISSVIDLFKIISNLFRYIYIYLNSF